MPVMKDAFLVCFLSAISIVLTGCEEQRAANHLTQGDSHLAKGDEKAAVEEYSKAIKLDPKLREAYVKRAEIYHSWQSVEKEIHDLNRAIELDSSDLDAWTSRGNARLVEAHFEGEEDFQPAIDDFTHVLSHRQDAEVYRNRGYCWYRMEMYQHAIDDLDRSIELNHRTVDNLHLRGRAYLRLGNVARAHEDFNESIRLAPDRSSGYWERGSAYLEQQEFDKAVEDFTKVVRLKPESITGYEKRAEALEALGKTDEAEDNRIRAAQLKAQEEQNKSDKLHPDLQ